MTIYVFGATGLVGKAILKSDKFSDKLVPIYRQPRGNHLSLDLNKPFDFNFDIFNEQDVVIFLAAISSPDFCEREYQSAYDINVNGSRFVISEVLRRGSLVLFASSDAVYGECEASTSEQAECRPLGAYAKMKFEIEDEFRLLSNFKALRFSLITSYYDKFTSYLMHCNDKKDTAVTFTNVKRCPLAIVDLVDGLNVIIRKHKTIPDTVINFGGPNFLSRSEMAENCKNYYLPELSLKHSEAAATFFQSRAKSININSNRLEEILNRSLTSNELFFGRLKRKNIR